MLVVACDETVEVYDANDLVARADYLVVTINEKNFTEWYGALFSRQGPDGLQALARLQGRNLTLSFQCRRKGYNGLISLTSGPEESGGKHRISFRGVDLLNVVR